ncbi:hypothetical protein [Thiomonas sp.]
MSDPDVRTVQVNIFSHSTKIWASLRLSSQEYLAFWGAKSGIGMTVRGGQIQRVQGSVTAKENEKRRKGYNSVGVGPVHQLGQGMVDKLQALLAGDLQLALEVLGASNPVKPPITANPLPKGQLKPDPTVARPWSF